MNTLLVMAGGTGGHVFPALAVAKDLRARGVNVIWLGTQSGLEARAVPAAGFDVEWINIKGVRGKGFFAWLCMPVLMLRAMLQTGAVIKRRKPSALLGMGGFVAGPGGLMAWIMRRPLLIHEANARVGFTNRWLAYIARHVLSGFPGVFEGRIEARHVGNPVHPDIAAMAPPEARMQVRKGQLRLLILGGSQGAQTLNKFLPAALVEQNIGESLDIWHQSGTDWGQEVRAAYKQNHIVAKVDEFINDMARAYGWADLVICRAGAMTVAEICSAGVGAIFVPFPYAVGDHQTENANFLVRQEAAILIPQHELNANQLVGLIKRFNSDRSLVLDMARRARSLAKADATRVVADMCLETLRA